MRIVDTQGTPGFTCRLVEQSYILMNIVHNTT